MNQLNNRTQNVQESTNEYKSTVKMSQSQASIDVIRRFVKYLKKRIDLRREEWEYYCDNHVCTFCGELERECGGDHVDEMRDIMRESCRGWDR
jgi:hypothetical protein